MPREDLLWALSKYQATIRRRAYNVFWRYDQGDHPMAFASDKFRAQFFRTFRDYSENLCKPVVDALDDRLTVTGFRSSNAEPETKSEESGITGVPPRKTVTIRDETGQQALDLWHRNRMDLRAPEAHREALLMGDAYVIVWPNDEGEAEIWPNLASECDVQYDPNNKGKLLRGCKLWYDEEEDKLRLNIYLPGEIEKYISKKKFQGSMFDKPSEWVYVETVLNPWGRVPMFHMPNQAQYKYGISELKDVIPIQDALNKATIDMMVAMEYASYKQRYLIGVDAEVDEETGQPLDAKMRNYGVDRIMAISDVEAKVGQFDATDLTQFLKVQEKFWLTAARVTGTPLHYFYITTGDFPSGEAIKSAEGRFIKRITDRQGGFGNVWEDVIKFAMVIDELVTEDELIGDEALDLSCLWEPATPRSDAELADTAVKKRSIGVPRSVLLHEMGYSDEEIERMLEEADAEMLAKAATQQAFAPPQGGPPGANNRPQIQPGQPTREQTRARQGVPGAGARR